MDQTSSDNRTDQPFTIRKAETNEDLQEIAALADVIWHEHFTPIIGKEQVEYMLSRFQSYPALQDQVLTGYEYYRLLGNRKLCGYMAIRQDQDGRMFLSKLYIAKQYRGRHLAAFLFDFLKNLCRQRNCSAIWLTCNKHNDHSLNVYRHFGFQTIDAQKNDIGNGFFMDDYIMEYRCFPNKKILRNSPCLPACKQKNIATRLRDTT